MTTFAKKIIAIVLALCLGMSMGLQAFAATTVVESEPEITVEGGITTVVKTTTETTEEGDTTTVVVTIETKKDGVDETGATVDYDETKVTTTETVEGPFNTVITEKCVTDGSETKEWKDLEVEIGDEVPEVEVTAKPGDENSAEGSGTFEKTEGDAEITTTVDREVTIVAGEENVDYKIIEEILKGLQPDDYEGKYGVSYGSTNYGEWGTAPYEFGNYWDCNLADSPNIEKPDEEGYDYQFTGLHEIAKDPYRVNVWHVEYEIDEETGKARLDEEGKPVIKRLYALKPDGTPSSGWDKEGYPTQTKNFVLTKYGENGEKDRFLVYCIDNDTLALDNSWYKIANLEDSDYYPDEDSANHLRAIALNGYWSTEEGLGSISYIQENMRKAYGEDETITVTDYNGKPQTFKIHDLIADLCEGEALGATQAAIWSYSNGALNVQSGENTVIVNDNFTYATSKFKDNIDEGARTLATMRAMYYWLLSLEQAKTEEDTTVINEDNFVNEISLTVGKKVDEVTTVVDDVEQTNGVYETDLNFTLAFAPAENDDLLVCLKYTDLDGNEQTVIRRLCGEAEEGETYGSIAQNLDGSYTFEGLKLSENRDFDFKLNLQGTQNLKQGVYVYSAYGGTDESQTMVGIASGSREVDVTSQLKINFSVEESKDVRSFREWHIDGDPIIEIPKDPEDPEDPRNPYEPTVIDDDPTPLAPNPPEEQYDVPETETIVDEEVPLADVPGLGDDSAIWMLVAAFAVFSLVVINAPEKKRED